MSGPDRYDRQRRLAEVGTAGQERLLRAVVPIRGREGAEVASLYLERAGVSCVADPSGVPPAEFDHASWFRFDASRRVGAGAWRALLEIRKILEIGVP